MVGALAACGKEVTSAGGGGSKDVHTNPFRFGDTTDAGGIVVRETSVIPLGSKAAMSFYVRNAPAGTQVCVVWKDAASNAESGEQVKPIGNKGFVAFQQPNPLPERSYRVDIFYKPPEATDWQNLRTHVSEWEGRSVLNSSEPRRGSCRQRDLSERLPPSFLFCRAAWDGTP